MKITVKSPCRVDMAGGTLDIWPLYLFHENAVTVNFAVNRYTSCELTTRNDKTIILRSEDQGEEEIFQSLDKLLEARHYKLPLAAHIIRFFRPETGFELTTDSEAPAGAGISGSSSLIITISSAFNKLLDSGYSIEKIREISQNIEAQLIRVPTGCQDYYPAMYGGINAIELTVAGLIRKAIPADLAEFNQRIVLAYTGEPRNSGINNWDVTKAHINGSLTVRRNFDQIAAIAQGMRNALEKADWEETGKLIREEWSHRKKNAPAISTTLIDNLIEATRKHGCTGAKVCGAGGGGCVFFLVEHGAKRKIQTLIADNGAEVLDVQVAPDGVQVNVET